jgi:hypothetical protein
MGVRLWSMVTFEQLGRYGRLGNQMFQIAGVIGIATKNGYEYGFPKWINWDAYDRFNTKENINVFEYFQHELPFYGGSLPDHFVHWGYHDISRDNVSYSGHFQSEKYFSHCKELIKKTFEMKHEYPENEFTAVHIRMGDYGDDYHPICELGYYEKAFREIPGPYLIFSDDIEKAKQVFPNKETFFYEGDTYDSLKKMKSCKNHIISNSTYSWWAAWLAGGKVVAPKKWFGPAANLSAKDIYCENWIVI